MRKPETFHEYKHDMLARTHTCNGLCFYTIFLKSSAIIQHLFSFLSWKYSYMCHTNETMLKLDIRPPSSSSSSSSSCLRRPVCARVNIFPKGSRARCGCTSFHSRCLRHTFTKLNWFSRTTRTIHVHMSVRT